MGDDGETRAREARERLDALLGDAPKMKTEQGRGMVDYAVADLLRGLSEGEQRKYVGKFRKLGFCPEGFGGGSKMTIQYPEQFPPW